MHHLPEIAIIEPNTLTANDGNFRQVVHIVGN